MVIDSPAKSFHSYPCPHLFVLVRLLTSVSPENSPHIALVSSGKCLFTSSADGSKFPGRLSLIRRDASSRTSPSTCPPWKWLYQRLSFCYLPLLVKTLKNLHQSAKLQYTTDTFYDKLLGPLWYGFALQLWYHLKLCITSEIWAQWCIFFRANLSCNASALVDIARPFTELLTGSTHKLQASSMCFQVEAALSLVFHIL